MATVTPTLSKEAEDQIINALRDVAVDVDNRGLDPSAAIEKAARDHSWGRGFVRFASHAYNKGRQAVQRESQSNALGKLASFPLADPDRIIESIWPATVTPPSEKAAAAAISHDYQLHPSTMLASRRDAELVADYRAHDAAVKAAADACCGDCGKPMDDCNCQRQGIVLATKTAFVLNDERIAADRTFRTSHDVAVRSRDDLSRQLTALTDYFAKDAYYRLPFADVDMAARAMHGLAGERLMDLMYDRLPKSVVTGMPKEARFDPQVRRAKLVAVDPSSSPMRMIAGCIKAGEAWIHARDIEQQAKMAVDAATVAMQHAFNPPAAQPVTPSLLDPTPMGFKIAKQSIEDNEPVSPKLAGFGTWITASAVGSGTKSVLDSALGQSPNKEDRVVDQWMDLEDPAHDAKLREIRARANLTHLLNDDVLSGYDPEQVLQAYNRVAQMAPRVAGQPLAMTTLLRRHMQGNVEPFEAKEVSELEKSLRDQSEPSASAFNVLGVNNAPSAGKSKPAA